MSLLEEDTTRKKRADNILPKPEKDLEFEVGGNKEYEVKAIVDSIVYGQQINGNDQILALYYLVLWKGYPKEENTWKPLSTVIHI